jgi:hypothetical protein
MTIKRSHILGLQILMVMLLVFAFLITAATRPLHAQSYLVPELANSYSPVSASATSTAKTSEVKVDVISIDHKPADPLGFITRFMTAFATAVRNLP